MKKILTITLSILFTGTLVQTALAVWDDPTEAAPGSNAPAPINSSADAQIKTGGVSVGSLIVSGGSTLGDTALGCDATTDGLIRFNGGILQICSDEDQLEPITISNSEPLLPAICSAGEVAIYNTGSSSWVCGAAPQLLPECLDGQVMKYSTTLGFWECTDEALAKFVDGSVLTTDAIYTSGNVGIGTSDPQAVFHVNNTNDLTLTSTNHAATFGFATINVAMDNNEIMARDNGAVSDLHLQSDGGVLISGAANASRFQIADDGRMGIGQSTPDTDAKISINNTSHTGPNGWYTSIKFTNNSHNSIWNPAGGMYFGLHDNGNFYWGDESGGTHQGYPMILNSNTGDVTKNGTLAADYLILRGRGLYFGTGEQSLRGNNGEYLDYYSNHDTITQFIFRDKEDTQYGRVYGSGDGANFGLLDGDGHWMYLAVKDNYTGFYVNNSQKMRISSTGDVGIGTTAPAYRLDVADDSANYITYFRNKSTSASADGLRLTMNVAGTLVYDDHFASFRDNGGNLHGSIGGRNNGTQVLYWTASDRRLKENISTLNFDHAKEILENTRPVSFDWKKNGVSDYGYIAQEVKEAFPLAAVGDENKFEITEDEDGNKKRVPVYMNIAKDKFIPVIHAGVVGNISKTMKLERLITDEEEKIKEIDKKILEQQRQLKLITEKLN